MGIEFNVAAKAKEAEKQREDGVEEPEGDYIEVPIEDVVYRATRPLPGQVTMLTVASASTMPRMLMQLIQDIMGIEARLHIERLLWAGRIDINDLWLGSEQNPEGGLVLSIIREFSGRPTEPSTASADSQQSGGRKSTARARGKGSTSSTSDSTAS